MKSLPGYGTGRSTGNGTIIKKIILSRLNNSKHFYKNRNSSPYTKNILKAFYI